MKAFGATIPLLLANFLFVSCYPQGAPVAPSAAVASASAVQSSPSLAPASPGAGGVAPLSLPLSDTSSIVSAPGPSSSGGSIVPGNCQQTNVGGRYKVICSGPEKEALKSEHVLWLQSEGETPSIVDIEIPNYKIEELIKAGFKPGPERDAIINVLLKKPTTSVDAQVDKQTSSASVPKVNLQYETGSQKLTHFPVDQPYSPLAGPLLPPNDGKAAAPTQARRLLKKRKRTPTTPAPVDEVDE